MIEKMNGILKRFYRRDESTGFSCFGIETDEIDVRRNSDGFVYGEGIIPKWPVDTYLILDGTWDEFIYKVKSAKPFTETQEISKKLLKQIVKDLTEENEDFKISNAGIKKILEVAGQDILTFSKRKDGLNVLIESLPKIKKETLELIFEKLTNVNESYRIIDYISQFGGSAENCDKLIKLYGPSAMKRLKKFPYQAGFLSGMDFYTCDRLAQSLKVDALAGQRISSMIYTALDEILNQSGSTYTTQYALKKQVARIAKKSAYPNETIPASVLASTIQQINGITIELMKNGIRIYRKFLYDSEIIIASNLKRLNEKKPNEQFKASYIEEVERVLDIKYSEKQKEAFQSIRSNGVKIITGGPGTGKTTIVNGILYMYQKMYPKNKILLCAPTGRAAQRMSEITLMDASTLHRALQFQPFDNGTMINKNADNPLAADLIILDEMSMVDTEIFSILLPSIKDGSTLILIGDENQLQSVSYGNVLHDLIESKQFDMYRLKEVFRQKGKTTIIDNAYRILEGKMDFIKDDSFEIVLCESVKDAVDSIIQTFDKLHNSEEAECPQILSPVKIGDGGTKVINDIISEKLNVGIEPSAETVFRHYKTTYHLNDKVIFGRNNYEKEYYNGDIGYITEILKNGILVKVGSDIKRITGECLKDVSLAYAITIHKSQGSEAENILIILPDTYAHMLNQNMLFTAVTRAKKYVKIVYVNSALFDSVHTIKTDKRNTGLVDKLTGVKREVLN